MKRTAKYSFIDGELLQCDVDSEFDFIVPGFIDVHCHGGGGKSFSEDSDTAKRAHYVNGTRVQLASLVTQDLNTLIRQVSHLKGRDIFGIHLEGPYLSEKFCGAHDPNLLRTPNLNELQALIDAGEGSIKMVTIAPELPNGIKAIEFLASKKVLVGIGHSAADAEITKKAIEAGASVVTHFNNAMSKIPNKDSLSEFALNSDIYLELIQDGHHVSKDVSLAIINKASDRIIAVTDAMSAAGAPDGSYLIGDLKVNVKDGAARLEGKDTLAGSTLTMLDAFLNFHALIGFEKAVRYTSLNPAKLLGINPYDGYIGIKGRSVVHL